jgi:hypothetical protein
MTPESRERLQASLRQRLLNLAQAEEVDFQVVLSRFGRERFLYRLGKSSHQQEFILKGAFLFFAWHEDTARPTRDIDLLGYGTPDIPRLIEVISDIARGEVEDDGLDFPTDVIRGQQIRETSLYDGIRFKLEARLGQTRIPLRIDIGFGDAAGSEAVILEYPTLLEHAPPRILAYQPYFVVAEKLEAIVALGMINTRLKDYYDIWWVNRTMDIPERKLVEAVRTTFTRRGTAIPSELPVGLSGEFTGDGQKLRMWEAFLTRSGLEFEGGSLKVIVEEICSFLWPIIVKAGTEP